MLRIITDTASDITKEEALEKNIILAPLTVMFGGISCPCETSEDFNHFYELLESHKDLPTTSQPSPSVFLHEYELAKEAGDEVLVLTISSGLSGTYQSACLALQMAEYDKISVVDTGSVIMGQRLFVDRAVQMRTDGYSREEIVKEIESNTDKMIVCGVVDSLVYLKKGGRIPPALAVVGSALNIKPALIIKNGVIEPIAKSRGMNQATNKLCELIEESSLNGDWPVYFGYVRDKEPGEGFMNKVSERFNLDRTALFPVGATVGTHVGPGCVILAFLRK